MAYLTLLPILLYFLAGILLRSAGLGTRDHARFVFRLVFFVTLPALAFQTIVDAGLTGDSVLLPFAGFAVNLLCAAAAVAYARVAGLEAPQAGAVILGAAIVNMAFMYPFILAVLGATALAEAVLFDIGNAIFVATVAYTIALRYGGAAGPSVVSSLNKMLRSPLFIALAAAIVFNVFDLAVPPWLIEVLAPLAAATIPLILIGLGLSFSVSRLEDSLPIHTVILRMLVGFIAGIVVAWAFGFAGMTAVVVIASAAAPVGFNSVTLASIGSLDIEQSVAALSLSVAVGLVTATLLLIAGARWLESLN